MEIIENMTNIPQDALREQIHKYVDVLNERCLSSGVPVPKIAVAKELDTLLDSLLTTAGADVRARVHAYADRNISIHTKLAEEIVGNADWHLGKIDQLKNIKEDFPLTPPLPSEEREI